MNELLTDLNDLMGRCRVVAERKFSNSGEPGLAIIQNTVGLPSPPHATNEHLAALKPMYMELINDIQENKESSTYLQPLFHSTRKDPDAAIALLMFIQFPSSVRRAREDLSGLSNCTVTEAYEWQDIHDDIATNKTIGAWCREVLAKPDEYHAEVLSSAINLLLSHLDCSNDPRRYISRIVLRGPKNKKNDFFQFRSDLARTVARPDLRAQAVAMAVQIQQGVLAAMYGDNKATEILSNAPNKDAFLQALDSRRSEYHPDHYQFFRLILGVPLSDQEILEANTVIAKTENRRNAFNGVAVCDADGCNKPGTKTCARCKLATYCGRSCQVKDWHAHHKQVCKSRKTGDKENETKIEEAAAAARSNVNSNHLYQDELLLANPGMDYIVVTRDRSPNIGINFREPTRKMQFKALRAKAPSSPRAVGQMYDMLCDGVSEDFAAMVRHNLQVEYVVDPLSDEAKHAPS